MPAIASDFRFLGSGFFTQLAAVLLSLWRNAKTGNVSTFFCFVGGHNKLSFITRVKIRPASPYFQKQAGRRQLVHAPLRDSFRRGAFLAGRLLPVWLNAIFRIPAQGLLIDLRGQFGELLVGFFFFRQG